MKDMAPWAYSKVHAFEQCPKQFYHEKVKKEYPWVESEAILYGNEFHKAAEDYLVDDTPLPKKFEYAKPMMDSIIAKKGVKMGEYKFGITKNLKPCGFFDKDVWFRGIADVIVLDEENELAWIFDHKTGKSAKYADKGQLELMALGIFAHFPKVKKIRAGLLYVVSKDVIKASYTIEDRRKLWEKWIKKFNVMQGAARKDVWNPRPNGLCKAWCQVTVCPHNGRN